MNQPHRPRPKFLSAEWRYLAMLNYQVDPSCLQPVVPAGTELDFFAGRTFLSVVGFRFLETKIFGVPIPGHRDFDEVNLRFYVRRKTEGSWRRGVVFIRELVPRRAIAWIARTVYGEPYSAVRMRHCIDRSAAGIRVEYGWQRAGRWESLSATGAGEPGNIAAGSEEEFITEHYWGYTARRAGADEYEVEHPRWKVWSATETRLEADVRGLYGERYLEALSVEPSSAFIAEGSAVVVRRGSRLR